MFQSWCFAGRCSRLKNSRCPLNLFIGFNKTKIRVFAFWCEVQLNENALASVFVRCEPTQIHTFCNLCTHTHSLLPYGHRKTDFFFHSAISFFSSSFLFFSHILLNGFLWAVAQTLCTFVQQNIKKGEKQSIKIVTNESHIVCRRWTDRFKDRDRNY